MTNNNQQVFFGIYEFILQRRKLYCAACFLSTTQALLHTYDLDAVTTLLHDPVVDKFWNIY